MSRQPTPKQLAKRDEIAAFFKASFERAAVNGILGDPNGTPAYAYLRVSSTEQAEEGRGGLPRQLDHVHEIALKTGRRVEWANVYADDHTGFDLHRPAIDRLMAVLERSGRGAAVVMEYIDRLARDADWQGVLLKQMEKAGVTPVFWKDPGNRLMRRVTGAVEQEYIEQVKARMYDGRMSKARDGRVTVNRACYGYKLVDSNGEQGEKARKDTHYAIREDTAVIICELYQRIAAAEPLRQIARDLEARGVSTPRGCKTWFTSTITPIIKNSVYKGEFVARRVTKVEIAVPTQDGLSTEWVERRVKRPEEEWIVVPVPPIVDTALWQAANDMLAKNKQSAARNANTAFLLGGMIKCAKCGYTYTGKTGNPQPQHRHYNVRRGYECRYGSGRAKDCHQRLISARLIENAVWKAVCDALLNPDALLASVEADTFDEQNAQIERDIMQLEDALTTNAKQADRLLKLYLDERIDEDEYSAERAALKDEKTRLQAKVEKLLPLRADAEAFEAKRLMIEACAYELAALGASDALIDPPFEIKQRLLKMCVDRIDLNAREGWFELHGVLRGTYSITKTSTPRQFRRRASRSSQNCCS